MLLTEWVEDLRIEVPAAIDRTIARALTFALQEFFRDSEAWRLSEDLSLVVGEVEYYLSLPSNTYIASLDFAYISSDSVAKTKLIHTLPERIDHDVEGLPTYIAAVQDKVVVDCVSEPVDASIGVVVQPNRNVTEIPDLLADKWFEYIRAGALMRLTSMSQKDWTDAAAAQAHAMTFNYGIEKAKREAREYRSRPKRSVKFNKSFAW